MRVEPGHGAGLHRHTGPVHAFNLAGTRRILGSGELVGPGDYTYEPGGMVDGWQAIGDEACIVHLHITGVVEYLDAGAESPPSTTQRRSARPIWPGREANVVPVPQVIGDGIVPDA